jgi:hypothetical protein
VRRHSGTIAKVVGLAACPVGRLYDEVNGIRKTSPYVSTPIWHGQEWIAATDEFVPEET